MNDPRRFAGPGASSSLRLPRLAALLLACATTTAAFADWPQFRGADGSAALPGAQLPVALNPARHIAWQVPLPGRGLSSPIVVGDRVFVTCSSGPKQTRLHVIAFRASDGTRLWERQFVATGRTMCHPKTSVAANTPATDGRHLFALFSSNDLFALDLEGNLVWLRALALDYPNVSNSLGMASSLLVVEGTVVAQVENDTQPLALGLDAATGVNRWKHDRPKLANWTSPVAFRDPVTGRMRVALQSGRGLLAVDPVTGEEGWNYPDGASTVASTAASGGVLFVPSFGITALQPGPAGQSPAQLWRAGTLRPGTSSPAVLADRLYVVNAAGVLTAGDADTGQRLWQVRLKGPFSASPVIAGHHLYLPNETGLLQVVDLSRPEGEVVGELPLEDIILSTPSISDNALYLRSDRTLWKIADQGSEAASSAASSSSPATGSTPASASGSGSASDSV
ncbi:MAG: PQQ-binding-like beta-propeller repeat protein [Verrucomicrobiae bacterium]|nr:PQQ-binding-like beta-propeller repeat protein [Verrucomicrobiae bacterium]